MTTIIVLDLSVGSLLTLADAIEIAALAEDTGVTAVRLLDGGPEHTLDTTAVAAYLAGRFPRLRCVLDAPTSHNAPYNLARRVLSLDRATGGNSGLVLRAGDGDETSLAVVPEPTGVGRPRRWAEYAHVLTRLWESFPATALLGDQATGVFAEDSLITPIDHEGPCYRVKGPLDSPSSPQGRPVLVADARDGLDWADVAALADAVVVTEAQAPEADARLTGAAERAGRRREDIALLGRIEPEPGAARPTADEIAGWAARNALDGLELAARGDLDHLREVLRTLVPPLAPAAAPTLRRALGLPEPIGVTP